MPIDLLTFLIAITLLTMTPGADTMIVIRNTLRGGAKDGLVSSLGICSGLFVHATLSAVGISAVLLYSATAFTVLKIAGALYLIWLGIGSFKSLWNSTKVHQKAVEKKPFSFWISIREGFLSNVLNPKAVIFYMAFLPQFINHEHSALAQSLFLALLHFIVGTIWQAILVYTIVSANGFITQKSVRQSLDAVSGVVMVGLGIRLLMEKR